MAVVGGRQGRRRSPPAGRCPHRRSHRVIGYVLRYDAGPTRAASFRTDVQGASIHGRIHTRDNGGSVAAMAAAIAGSRSEITIMWHRPLPELHNSAIGHPDGAKLRNRLVFSSLCSLCARYWDLKLCSCNPIRALPRWQTVTEKLTGVPPA